MNAALDLGAIAAVIVATALIGVYGLRVSRTTSDFFVASRTVRPVWNASAISGEYLSAGTFLGLSGLVLLAGARRPWFPIGYAAGYLLVLVFVAAPPRRSGAYTIPDFVEARLESRPARRVTSIAILVIGWLYIVPQLHGAGITLEVVAGVPVWVGAVVVAVLVAALVAAGGMRAITFVQGFQYWLKLTALLVPLVLIVFALQGTPQQIDPAAVFPAEAGPGGIDAYETGSLLLALLLGPHGAAARARPLLHEPRRRLGAADDGARHRHDQRVLRRLERRGPRRARRRPRARPRRPRGGRHRRARAAVADLPLVRRASCSRPSSSLVRSPRSSRDVGGSRRLARGGRQPGRVQRVGALVPAVGGAVRCGAARRCARHGARGLVASVGLVFVFAASTLSPRPAAGGAAATPDGVGRGRRHDHRGRGVRAVAARAHGGRGRGAPPRRTSRSPPDHPPR